MCEWRSQSYKKLLLSDTQVETIWKIRKAFDDVTMNITEIKSDTTI